MADESKAPLTRWDAKVAWVTVGAAVLVVGAYFRLEARVAEVDRRAVAIETRQDTHDAILRGIERSVSRIEGRLGIDVPQLPAQPVPHK